MKTVVQVLPSLVQGGVETEVLAVANYLKTKGVENIVISNGGPLVAQLAKKGIVHIQMPVHTKNPLKMILNGFRLAQLVKKYHVGLFHVHSRAPAWSVSIASSLSKVPFISTYHGLYGLQPKIKKIYNRVMLKGLCTVAVSKCVKNHLIQNYQYPENKICVIYGGVDLKRFDVLRVTHDQTLAFAVEKQIPLDKPIITLVGRFSKIKGQLTLLKAIQQMTHKDITCLLIGGKAKPDYEALLRQEIAYLPSGVDVCCLSLQNSDLPFAYALSDVVVSATLVPETFGLTLVEAGAMKKIVVAFDQGGPKEIIQDKQTGFLIPVGNEQLLAQALDKVLSMNAKEKRKMETAAYERVVQNFSMEKMCEQNLKLYQEILK